MGIIFIAFCGALGALVRSGVFVFSPVVLRRFSSVFSVFALKESMHVHLIFSAVATLFCNVLAVCLLGMLVVFAAASQKKWGFFCDKKIFFDGLTLGFCGSLSTFSAFTKETFFLWQHQFFFLAVFNVVVNVFFSLVFFYLFYRWALRLI